jgi:CubicO group peptidase (beta-lactamase class C family)
LAYAPAWLAFQMRQAEQPGASVAIVHDGEVVWTWAAGVANLATGEPMSPGHQFRVASHSKTFTAAAVLKLREAGRLGLDDAAGRWVAGLHPDVARSTIAQLLSHSAGLTRDGADAGQFMDIRPFLSVSELKADLACPQPLPPAETFKYSNHGMALLGLIIEAATGEPYHQFVQREVIDASGLSLTVPDIVHRPAPPPPFASGHSTKWPYGERFVVAGTAPANAITAAGGYLSTAAGLARFYASLDPAAEQSVLAPASRRELTRRHWRDRDCSIERYYGYGTMVSAPGPWAHFGHGGSWQGTLSRTVCMPDQRLAISVLTNAVDGPAQAWVDGLLHMARTLADAGAEPVASPWTGRWWTLWGAVDLVPVSPTRVLVATPGLPMPFMDASVIEVACDTGRVIKAQAYGDLGETVALERDGAGTVTTLRIGGKRLVPDAQAAAIMRRRYGA